MSHRHVPLTQLVAPGHARSQAPQWSSSVHRLTHAPTEAQNVSPETGHRHAPSWHVVPVGHALPHEPQFAAFDWRSTHASSARQYVCPLVGQAHAPAVHNWAAGHSWSQAPQWLRSVRVSTQPTVPQWVVLASAHTQVPPEQVWPGPHASPHPPQCRESEYGSTHAPSHSIAPAAAHRHAAPTQRWSGRHARSHAPQWLGSPGATQAPAHSSALSQRQMPPLQRSPRAHRTPHPPQCRASIDVSAHSPSQSACPGTGHAHTPPPQSCAAGHALPHAPQFASSVIASTQPPPHGSVRPGESHVHSPSMHASPASQARSQLPQCLSSEARSTHSPPQTSGAPAEQPQAPASQRAPRGHAVSQLPQWLASFSTSTQAPAHSVLPGGQRHSPRWHSWSARHARPHSPQCSRESTGTSTPAQTRQSSIVPLQSLSRPSPQTSFAAVAAQTQARVGAPSENGHVHDTPGGQSTSLSHGSLQTLRPGATSEQIEEAHCEPLVHASPMAPPEGPASAVTRASRPTRTGVLHATVQTVSITIANDPRAFIPNPA